MGLENDWIAFRMMEIDFEWDGGSRTLTTKPKSTSPALRELVRNVILDCSGPEVPAAVAIRRAGERLAQRVTQLRFVAGDE